MILLLLAGNSVNGSSLRPCRHAATHTITARHKNNNISTTGPESVVAVGAGGARVAVERLVLTTLVVEAGLAVAVLWSAKVSFRASLEPESPEPAFKPEPGTATIASAVAAVVSTSSVARRTGRCAKGVVGSFVVVLVVVVLGSSVVVLVVTAGRNSSNAVGMVFWRRFAEGIPVVVEFDRVNDRG
jgi:hypothetical protein